MWSTGTGSDVMKRIAAPMIGGIFTSFLLELVVYPMIYHEWKWRREPGLRLSALSRRLIIYRVRCCLCEQSRLCSICEARLAR